MTKLDRGEKENGRGEVGSKSVEQSARWGLRRAAKSVSGRDVGFSTWAQAANLIVGQVIIAREMPVVQGIVLGKSKTGESVRVLTAKFTLRKFQHKASISDIPFFFIPSQSLRPEFVFSEIDRIVGKVKEGMNKVGFARGKEEELLQWIEEGCVETMGKKEVVMEESEEEGGEEEVAQEEEEKPETNSTKEKIGVEEISSQVMELTKIVAELVNRQKKEDREKPKDKIVEEVVKKKSKEESDWGELTARVEKLRMEKEKGKSKTITAGGRRRNINSDEEEEAQVSEGEVEWLDCPFKRRHKRQVNYRTSPSQRKLIRRLLEEIYGGHETAAQAANSILGNFEVDGRVLSWEEAQMVNYAKILDIVLVGNLRGPWTTWNEGAVDMLAKSFFEMVARVRPAQDVVEVIEMEWQKKLKEMNFGRNRTYGPITYKQKGVGRGQGASTWGWKGYGSNVQVEGEVTGGNKGGWRSWQSGEGSDNAYAGRGQWRPPRTDAGGVAGHQGMGYGIGWNSQVIAGQEPTPNLGGAGQQVAGCVNQVSVLQPAGRGIGNFLQPGVGRGWG